MTDNKKEDENIENQWDYHNLVSNKGSYQSSTFHGLTAINE